MPIDPSELTKSIGALGTLDSEQDLAPTLQQVVVAAKQLFQADGAGLMLIDAKGQLRWASASDQTAQALEDGQERLAQGPCMAAFSQRAPAVIRDISAEPDWGELTGVMLGEGICAALSVPVELDGSPIGTLDIYSSVPWDWDDSEIATAQAYAGLVASLLTAAVTAKVQGRLANQLQAALEHRWLIEQAKGMVMARERLDAQAALSGSDGRPAPRAGGWPMWPGMSPPASGCRWPTDPSQGHGSERSSRTQAAAADHPKQPGYPSQRH